MSESTGTAGEERGVRANIAGRLHKPGRHGGTLIGGAVITATGTSWTMIDALRKCARQHIEPAIEYNADNELRVLGNSAQTPDQNPKDLLGIGDPWATTGARPRPGDAASTIVQAARHEANAIDGTTHELKRHIPKVVAGALSAGWRLLWRKWLTGMFGARTLRVHRTMLTHELTSWRTGGAQLLTLASGPAVARERRLRFIERYPMTAPKVLGNHTPRRMVETGRSDTETLAIIAVTDLGGPSPNRMNALKAVWTRQWGTRVEARHQGRNSVHWGHTQVESAGWLDPNDVPTNRGQWAMFLEARNIAGEIKHATYVDQIPGGPINTLAATALTHAKVLLRGRRTVAKATQAAQSMKKLWKEALEGAHAAGVAWVSRTVTGEEPATIPIAARARQWDESVWCGQGPLTTIRGVECFAAAWRESKDAVEKLRNAETTRREEMQWDSPDVETQHAQALRSTAEVAIACNEGGEDCSNLMMPRIFDRFSENTGLVHVYRVDPPLMSATKVVAVRHDKGEVKHMRPRHPKRWGARDLAAMEEVARQCAASTAAHNEVDSKRARAREGEERARREQFEEGLWNERNQNVLLKVVPELDSAIIAQITDEHGKLRTPAERDTELATPQGEPSKGGTNKDKHQPGDPWGGRSNWLGDIDNDDIPF